MRHSGTTPHRRRTDLLRQAARAVSSRAAAEPQNSRPGCRQARALAIVTAKGSRPADASNTSDITRPCMPRSMRRWIQLMRYVEDSFENICCAHNSWTLVLTRQRRLADPPWRRALAGPVAAPARASARISSPPTDAGGRSRR
jgi:hypothetical protein